MVWYSAMLNNLSALPISDVAIARQTQQMTWTLYEAYKLGAKYDMEILPFGRIFEKNISDSCPNSLDTFRLNVQGTFSNYRRHNLRGVKVICGLVVRK